MIKVNGLTETSGAPAGGRRDDEQLCSAPAFGSRFQPDFSGAAFGFCEVIGYNGTCKGEPWGGGVVMPLRVRFRRGIDNAAAGGINDPLMRLTSKPASPVGPKRGLQARRGATAQER